MTFEDGLYKTCMLYQNHICRHRSRVSLRSTIYVYFLISLVNSSSTKHVLCLLCVFIDEVFIVKTYVPQVQIYEIYVSVYMFM